MSSADCERLRPYLLDYVVGELDPAEAERLKLEGHLAGCVECRAAVEELRGTGRALEAVKVFDSQLNEEVRQDISRRARMEAEKLRAAHGRGGGAGPSGAAAAARPVPVLAWLVLGLGTAAVLAGVALLPRVSGTPGGARLVGASGVSFRQEFAPGEAISVPPGALLQLQLADGSRFGLRGPAEAVLGGPGSPLKISRGSAWLAVGDRPVSVVLDALRKLELAANAQAAFEIQPSGDEPACVAVLGGTVSYSASGGDGQVAQGQTLAVKQSSGLVSVRPSKATETAPWRSNLPGGEDGRK